MVVKNSKIEKTVKETPAPTLNSGVVSTVIERTQSSCLIKTDTKGTKSYEIKVYAESADEAVSIAIEQAKILDKEVAKTNTTKGDK
jgi:hypothetical protein